MAIIAKKGEGKDFPVCPAGTVQAVCNDVWDIGLQKVKAPDGSFKIQHKIIISWETTELMTEGEYKGKRFCVSKRYTLSMHDKATLTVDVESWLGRALTDEEKDSFDVESLIGQNCMLGIVHNASASGDRRFANVGSVSKVMKGLPLMTPENERKIPDWINKLVEKGKLETADPSVVLDMEGQPVPF